MFTNKNYKNSKAITLISLVISIIILLILIIVSVKILFNNNIIDKSNIAKNEYNNSQIEEIFKNDLSFIAIEEKQEINIDILSKYTKDNNYIKSQSLQVDILEVKNGKNKILITYEYPKNSGKTYFYEIFLEKEKLKKYISFEGSTYLETNIPESEILKNNEFTIAARVYIERDNQKNINYMDILGNHVGTQGFVWQFKETSTTLAASYSTNEYKSYYSKWTDIVMTYNNGSVKMYFNGELKGESKKQLNAYNKFCIGSGFGTSRAMVGNIQKVIIWNRKLTEDNIKNINYNVKYNNIKEENIIQEFNFESVEQINKYGNIIGKNYSIKEIK